MKLEYEQIQPLVFGVEYTDTDHNKILFSRFSKEELGETNHEKDNRLATAGVRIEFETDSRYIRIATSVKESNPDRRNFYSFDISCNGSIVGQIKNFNRLPQYPYKKYNLADRQKTFYLKSGLKHICIYFPWSVQGMIREIELDDGAVITPVQKKRKLIMYGDSITQGYDAAQSSLSYASILADKLNANIMNKGIGGSFFLPELTKCESKILPDFITVAYGTNDWKGADFEDFKKRSYVFFENLVSNYPNVPIFVIAPIWRADHNEKHKLGSFSTIANTLKQISNDCKDLYFIDGIDFIPKDRTYYRDGYLHPNENGFKLYADALLNELYQTIL